MVALEEVDDLRLSDAAAGRLDAHTPAGCNSLLHFWLGQHFLHPMTAVVKTGLAFFWVLHLLLLQP